MGAQGLDHLFSFVLIYTPDFIKPLLNTSYAAHFVEITPSA